METLCNHCGSRVDRSKLTDFQCMCFRGMCHECEALTLEQRIERFPKLREVAEQVRRLGLGVNGPLAPGFMANQK